MLALRKTVAAPGLQLVDAPEPPPLKGTDILIEVAVAGICGSDLHVAAWGDGYEFMAPLLPVTLGHEFSGRVVAVGPEVASVSVGQRVTAWPSAPCGICNACKTGLPQNCLDKNTVGLFRNGAFTRFVIARESGVFPLPDEVDFELAALTEPLCVGARAVEVGDVRQGSNVVVLGPGSIGQAAALFARYAGALNVAVVGFNDAARFAVLQKLGFDDLLDLADESDRNQLQSRAATADVVIEATGHPSSIDDGMRLLRNEGTLVVTGIHPAPATIDLRNLVRRRLQLRGTHGARRDTWARVIRTLTHKGEDLRPMITHRFPLSHALEGFELARSRSASKVMIFPEPSMPGQPENHS